MNNVHGVICTARVYKYKGWTFETHALAGPWPLNKDGNPKSRTGDIFFNMYAEFSLLSGEEKKRYCVEAGGCHRF